ncbi:MAG: AsmA-like C-terminal region-containing protein [Planctomycetota bacterium]|nr:AsmA-like C-terminal region-containing protein [Planctomycetota bacterium]
MLYTSADRSCVCQQSTSTRIALTRDLNGERIRIIFTRLINLCWSILKYGVLLGGLAILAAVFGSWYFQNTINDKIRDRVEKTIAEGYPHLAVRVEGVRRIEGKGILVRGLSLTEKKASGPQTELAFFQEVLLGCQAQLQELITDKLNITHIVIRRPTLRGTRRTDGTWSLQKLFPLPSFGGTAKSIRIEQGEIVLFDPLKNPSGILKISDANYVVQFSTHQSGDGKAEKLTSVKGSMLSEHLGRIELEGKTTSQTQAWQVSGRVENATLSPELQQDLPGDLAQHLTPIRPLRGQLGLQFRVHHKPGDPLQFTAQGKFTQGSFDDDRLPYPISDIEAEIHLNQNGGQIKNATAHSGRTQFSVEARFDGYHESANLLIRGKATHLVLDQQIAEILPPAWSEQWNRYRPDGEINADFQIHRDHEGWHPQCQVECLSLAFTHYKFPYRMERTQGTINLQNNQLYLQLSAQAGDRPVEIVGRIDQPGPRGVGEVFLKADNVPLDEKLIRATPEKIQQVIKSFSPQGTVNIFFHSKRETSDEPWFPHCVVDLNGIAIRYKKFGYPLQNVKGRLEGRGKTWAYRDLMGTNDTGIVMAEGTSKPTTSGIELDLQIDAKKISLDQELQHALPSSMRQLWAKLRPAGDIDASIRLNFASATKALDLSITTDLNKIRIEPVFFPYRMENLSGKVDYKNGHARFSQLVANHGKTNLTASGNCHFSPAGNWTCHFTEFNIDRLRMDRELLIALPSGLRSGISALQFSGPMNLNGAIRFTRGSSPNAPVTSDWNVGLETVHGKIDCGITLDQIHGGINLSGSFNGKQFYSQGELDLDSVLYENFQFTGVRGPIWFNDQYLLFGGYAERQVPGKIPRRISADFYGGRLVADCRIALSDTSRFVIDAQMSEADLAQFATEMIPGGRNLSGKMTGNLQLAGTSRGAHTLRGKGDIRLREGNVYELPLVLSLLKLLSIREPDSTAFNTCDVDFKIDGEHILFDEFNFHGDAISMLGKGEMDFDKSLRMVFHAVIGNDQLQLPVVRPLLGMASQQLMLLYVYGTLDNPKTTREALPGVRRAVQEMQTEAEKEEKNIIGKTNDWIQEWIPKR